MSEEHTADPLPHERLMSRRWWWTRKEKQAVMKLLEEAAKKEMEAARKIQEQADEIHKLNHHLIQYHQTLQVAMAEVESYKKQLRIDYQVRQAQKKQQQQ